MKDEGNLRSSNSEEDLQKENWDDQTSDGETRGLKDPCEDNPDPM